MIGILGAVAPMVKTLFSTIESLMEWKKRVGFDVSFVSSSSIVNNRNNLKDYILIHGGGWKKLESEKISNNMFKEKIRQMTGCEQVHNYYGMVEQTGSILYPVVVFVLFTVLYCLLY